MEEAMAGDDKDTQDVLDTVVGQASELIACELEDPIDIPAFSSVVARARRLDPSQVGPSLIRETWAAEASTGRSDGDIDPLARFVRAARVEAEADVRSHIAEVGNDPKPAASLFARKPPRLGFFVAAAAAAVLWFVFKGFPTAPSAARTTHERNFYQSVVDQSTQEHETEVERVPAPKWRKRPRPDKSPAVPSAEDPEPDDLVCLEQPATEDRLQLTDEDVLQLTEGSLQPDVEDVPSPPGNSQRIEDSPISAKARRPPDRDHKIQPESAAKVPIGDKLRELDDLAEAALARGELQAADELYREIIRRGGHSRRADRAYGDRFTIARRLRKPAGRAVLWREYLRVFPRGRFAEDALAGLCQEEQRRLVKPAHACWQNLLERFPHGVYASQARRALALDDLKENDEGTL